MDPRPDRPAPARTVQQPFPAVDDYLVEPETSRDEVVRGERMEAMGANPEHADRQCRLDYLLNAHAAEGYVAASELQTRFLEGSDFATDSCIRRAGVNPQTGRRYLEEMTFEVVNEQPLTGKRGISTKAEDMAQRGVRRIFAVFVKKGVVKEWVGAWQALPADGTIEDPCLAQALPVRAILEATEADDAVVRALEAKGNRVIRQIEDRGRKEGRQKGHKEGRQKGRKEGLQRALLTLLRARGFQVPDQVKDQVLSCGDPEVLERWIARAATAASLEPIFAG